MRISYSLIVSLLIEASGCRRLNVHTKHKIVRLVLINWDYSKNEPKEIADVVVDKLVNVNDTMKLFTHNVACALQRWLTTDSNGRNELWYFSEIASEIESYHESGQVQCGKKLQLSS
jgi:hypothetical protein